MFCGNGKSTYENAKYAAYKYTKEKTNPCIHQKTFLQN